MLKKFNEYSHYDSESKVTIQQDIESIMSDTMAYLLDDNINRNDELLVEARVTSVPFRSKNGFRFLSKA